MSDILNDMGDFLGTDELQNKFNLHINFLEYYSLRSAIPGKWKHKIRSRPLQDVQPPSTLYFIVGKECKDICGYDL